MFELYADKTKLLLRQREQLTSGAVKVHRVRFQFSADWEGLSRTAVFRAAGVRVPVLLGTSGECEIPWEVLQRPGCRLEAGVYGTGADGKTVLPTAWTRLGPILEGAAPGEVRPPTPELWEQALAGKGDTLGYTEEGYLGLYSGEKLLSAVPVAGGGGDHRLLSHRDAEDQHPIPAIQGLEEELRRIPAPMESLTNEELEEILK